MSCLDASDLPFCPGCTHEPLFKGLGAALEKSALDPREVVVVSDIGCHGIADRSLWVHTFHGLHGRSITYACGIKLARPTLRVVVLIGDGGCGIGGAHLINAARRNVGLCVVVFNNFNFGMTGGQHSVTTPAGARTSTTPGGNLERGFDLCKLAEASGATFVARATAFDENLKEVLAQGIAHDGFALVDVWGLCTAHYMKRNDVRKAQLVETARSMPGYGVLRSERAPEYASALRQVQGTPSTLESLAVPAGHASTLKRRLEIVLAGSAGMRVRTAAWLLARAAMRSGLYTAQKDTFPVTVMKGFSLSELILSPERIENLQVAAPDWLAVASEDGWKKARPLAEAARRVLIESSLAKLSARATAVDLKGVRKTELALALAVPAVRDVLPIEALKETLERDAHAEDRGRMLEALERGLAISVAAG
ncbi:MAG: 2-oxoglutarate synthase [Planctomycetes bacterium]|nr:2-oxoglutarate synthase [Planctomycetota bacterium]